MFLFVLFPKRKGASSLLFNFKLYNYATLLLQEHNKSEKHQPEVLGGKIHGAQENTIRIYNNERGGAIMDTGNITWVITLESGTPKVEIMRKPATQPKLECPSEREMSPEWDSGIYLSKEKGMRINMIRVIYSICLLNGIRDKYGNKAPDYKVFQAFGKLLHVDLSHYSNDLNRTMEENTTMERQTEFLRCMIAALQQRFDLY